MKLFITTAIVAAFSAGSPAFALGQTPTPQTESIAPGERLDSLVDRLNVRTSSDPALTVELETHLRDHPELLVEVPTRLRAGAVSSDAARTVIFAVEQVGTLGAQEALIQIQGDPGQRQLDRLRSVLSLGALGSPSMLSVATLWSVADTRVDGSSVELSNGALLGLGISGNKLWHGGSDSYPDIRDGLVARLHTAGDSHLRCMAMKAVGNLHDPALVEDVSAYLFDELPTVRVTAAQSVSRLGASAKRGLIAELLRSEPRGIVRGEYVKTLRGLDAESDALQIVHGMVMREAHPEARAQMVEFLVENLGGFPEARATLLDIARSDPTTRIRVLASAALRR